MDFRDHLFIPPPTNILDEGVTNFLKKHSKLGRFGFRLLGNIGGTIAGHQVAKRTGWHNNAYYNPQEYKANISRGLGALGGTVLGDKLADRFYNQ